MKIIVFAKKGKTREGKTFNKFVGRLHKADCSEIPVQVKFREECGEPKTNECPLYIIVDKTDANLSTRNYIREDNGETGTAYTLWISKWKKGEPYVDTSLDDFVD